MRTITYTRAEAIELLQAELGHFEAHPELHRQEVWFQGLIDKQGIGQVDCGSAMCLAGGIAHRMGYRFVDLVTDAARREPGQPVDLSWVIHKDDVPRWRQADLYARSAMTAGSSARDVASQALEALDYDGGVEDLWSATNVIEELWAKAYELTGGEIALPERIARLMWECDGNVHDAAHEAMRERIGDRAADEQWFLQGRPV